jgi:hypothetical protein
VRASLVELEGVWADGLPGGPGEVGDELEAVQPSRWHEAVAFHVGVDAGEVDPVDDRQGLCVDGGAADHEQLAGAEEVGQGLCHRQGVGDGRLPVDARERRRRISQAAHHDADAVRQGAAQACGDGLVGEAAHDGDVVPGHPSEAAQISGDVPRQVSVASDDVVLRGGDDQVPDHAATGMAEIAGCGS